MKRYLRLDKPIHQTWLFTAYCLGIVIGLAFSKYEISEWFSQWQWIAVSLCLLGFSMYRRALWVLLIALIAGTTLGLFRGSTDIVSRSVYAGHIGEEVTISGEVMEDVDIGTRGEKLVRLDNLKNDNVKLPSKIWVSTSENAEIKRSDRLTVNGNLSKGFGGFAASIYSAKIVRIERMVPGDVALQVRDGFGDQVRKSVDEPAASLGMGYLAGQRRGLPEDLDASLKIAGLTHIVVASGYNLTILIRFSKRLLEKRSRFAAIFTSLLLILGFILVTGFSPSMSRAGLVAGLALVAWYFGRKFHPITMLVLAAATTGLINPSYVWGDIGWQLSFAAFAGVMILAPLLQQYFFGASKPGWLRQIIGETLSAQICTLPIILFNFGSLSNVALVANILVLPLVPLAMLMTFVVGIVGFMNDTLAGFLGIVDQFLLDYMVFVAKNLSSLSWASTEIDFPFWSVIVAYLVILVSCVWMRYATKFRLRDASIIE